MDIMDLPPELLNAIYIGIGAIITAATAFIVALFVGGRYLFVQFTQIKVERKRIATAAEKSEAIIVAREAAADTSREEIINKMFVDFNEQLKDKQTQIDKQNEKYGNLRVDLAEERGKIIVLLDYRSELTKKIDKLERRIAELEHENISSAEQNDKLKTESNNLKSQLDEHVIKINELEEKLGDCEQEKEKEKLAILPQPKPSEPTEKSDNDNQEEIA
jgi:chromosome segregation ATPase